MALVNFYLIAAGTGSADINAGSSIGAAQATTTNGNWTSATGVFVAASGTPFASTIVGDYASVYVDGATVTTFVGIVTVKTSSTQITIDVTTVKYGTVPTTSATGRSCTINGSWNSEIVLAATGLATTTVPQSTKINCKGNLTIAASRTISMAGTTTAPLWFSGYNTTPGDLDNDTTNTLVKPIWTLNSTFVVTCSGAYQTVSGISVVGTRSGAVLVSQGSQFRLSRSRVENLSTNSAAVTYDQNSNNGQRAAYCWFKVPATANVNVNLGTTTTFVGCTLQSGGVTSQIAVSSNGATLVDCAFLDSAGPVAVTTTGFVVAVGCTFSNAVGDGVKWTTTPAASQPSVVVGCLFRSLGGRGINNASGTNSGNVYRACNDFYSCTQGNENGFGDVPAFFGQTESSDPVVSSSDMTPVTGSNARNNGFPGIFENETFSSYADIGAVRHQDPAGGGYAGGVYGA